MTEVLSVFRAGDNKNVTDIAFQQPLQRVKDHRFLSDGKQVFVNHHGQRIETASGTAGEEDSFHKKTLNQLRGSFLESLIHVNQGRLQALEEKSPIHQAKEQKQE